MFLLYSAIQIILEYDALHDQGNGVLSHFMWGCVSESVLVVVCCLQDIHQVMILFREIIEVEEEI